MSSFSVPVVKLDSVITHPNADRLDVAQVGGYQSIVGRGVYQAGDLAVYIPEQSLVPENILEEMGLTGVLAGPQKNRVKAIRLRGVVSQGLVYSPPMWPEHWVVDYDVAEELGIKKYEVELPVRLANKREDMLVSSSTILRTYDVENVKKFNHVLIEGEQVVFTEKLHGTCCIVGYDHYTKEEFVTSKGLAGNSVILKDDGLNTYWNQAKENNLHAALRAWSEEHQQSICLFGEIVGVQDLKYGLEKGQCRYYAFDVLTSAGFLSHEDFIAFCDSYGIRRVPILYEGPYSLEKKDEYTSGPSTQGQHIREGIVMYTNPLRYDVRLGAVRLKSISNDYLFRKGEQTEYQ